jgi:hypothetical protein
MKVRIHGKGNSPPLAASILIFGLLFAGCDDHITVIRNPDVPIPKRSTWAWRPMALAGDSNRRPVLSHDVISRGETVVRESSADNDVIRQRIRTGIEKTLAYKGLKQVSDPQAASFLVDYHVAVQRVSPGGYPGIVCGPYGCWQSWGWGPTEVSYENVRFREGTFVFDFVQQGTKRLAYRAIGQKPVHGDTFHRGEITEFIQSMLEKLKTHG